MARNDPNRPIFIYDTRGDWFATVIGGFVYDTRGEYVGWIEQGNQVIKRDGEWLGALNKDGRILRKRSEPRRPLHPNPPVSAPKPARLPTRAPLPGLMAELPYSIIDVLDFEPEVFKKISDLKPDMD